MLPRNIKLNRWFNSHQTESLDVNDLMGSPKHPLDLLGHGLGHELTIHIAFSSFLVTAFCLYSSGSK